jgi:hypothetical protein
MDVFHNLLSNLQGYLQSHPRSRIEEHLGHTVEDISQATISLEAIMSSPPDLTVLQTALANLTNRLAAVESENQTLRQQIAAATSSNRPTQAMQPPKLSSPFKVKLKECAGESVTAAREFHRQSCILKNVSPGATDAFLISIASSRLTAQAAYWSDTWRSKNPTGTFDEYLQGFKQQFVEL